MKIRWGVIGCGGIAKSKSIPGLVLAENSELVAVQDVVAEVAEKVKDTFGAKYAFTSAEELVKCAEVDAVYIASPLFCHKEQVICCAENGKHVLCEKPLGVNTAEIEEMIAACKKANVKFGVAFMERFHKHHMKAKELIAAGALGELVSLKAQWSFDYKPCNVWRQDIKLGGGGGFMDVGTHCIDILRYMSGLEVEEVVSLCGNQFYDYTVEDYSQLLGRMNNGAVMYVSSNYNVDFEPSRFEIVGRDGVIYGTKTFSQTGTSAEVWIKLRGEKEARPLEFEGEHNNMYTCEMAGFADAIINDTTPPVPAEEGLAAQRVVEAAYESQAKGIRAKVKK